MTGTEAVLEVDSYGYEVDLKINGKDVGIKGGMSEALRIFTPDHPRVKKLSPEIDDLACLKKGENEIVVKYKKINMDSPFDIKVTLSTEEQHKKGESWFSLRENKDKASKEEAEVSKTFRID